MFPDSFTDDAYLDLIQRALVNHLYPDAEADYDEAKRSEGRDWPPFAYTMIGRARLANLLDCCRRVKDVPGDFCEAGVWRGGASILMAAVNRFHALGRSVWVCDSFEGMPPPKPDLYPQDRDLNLYMLNDRLAVSLEQVKKHFARFGLLSPSVKFVKGWFQETLINPPMKSLSVLRIDCDLYESTMTVLENLCPLVNEGGYVLVDDYNDIPACKAAVDDYRGECDITSPIVPVDWTGVYWRHS